MYRDLLKKLFSEEKESFPEEMFLFDPPHEYSEVAEPLNLIR